MKRPWLFPQGDVPSIHCSSARNGGVLAWTSWRCTHVLCGSAQVPFAEVFACFAHVNVKMLQMEICKKNNLKFKWVSTQSAVCEGMYGLSGIGEILTTRFSFLPCALTATVGSRQNFYFQNFHWCLQVYFNDNIAWCGRYGSSTVRSIRTGVVVNCEASRSVFIALMCQRHGGSTHVQMRPGCCRDQGVRKCSTKCISRRPNVQQVKGFVAQNVQNSPVALMIFMSHSVWMGASESDVAFRRETYLPVRERKHVMTTYLPGFWLDRGPTSRAETQRFPSLKSALSSLMYTSKYSSWWSEIYAWVKCAAEFQHLAACERIFVFVVIFVVFFCLFFFFFFLFAAQLPFHVLLGAHWILHEWPRTKLTTTVRAGKDFNSSNVHQFLHVDFNDDFFGIWRFGHSAMSSVGTCILINSKSSRSVAIIRLGQRHISRTQAVIHRRIWKSKIGLKVKTHQADFWLSIRVSCAVETGNPKSAWCILTTSDCSDTIVGKIPFLEFFCGFKNFHSHRYMCGRLNVLETRKNRTSTLSQRRGRAPQSSIT